MGRHGKDVPAQLAESALSAILNALSDKKDDSSFSRTLSTAKGSVSFSSRLNSELFHIMYLIQSINPKKAEERLNRAWSFAKR
ncbi:MAG: hypothetical protein WKF37_16255 [Bryobacteraceae bacterium]